MKARPTGLVTLLTGALVLATAAVSSAAVDAAAPAAVSAAAPASAAQAKTAPRQAKLTLRPSSARLKSCYPKAEAKVTVDLTTAAKGFDTLTVKAKGLRPNTDYTVFLLQQAGPPFGKAEYFGDFTTNGRGEGANRFTLIVEEAFAFDGATNQRVDLNALGVWFADERDDDGCLGTNSPVTGFDGDGRAGVQMLNSGNQLLP